MLDPPTPRRPVFAELTVGAHRLSLFHDGAQTFPAMIEAIAAARSTVCLETYILRDDVTGHRFAAALAERARAGVEVNLLFDAWGSSVSTAYLEGLRQAGVRPLEYHPFRLDGRLAEITSRLTRRDHRKALIVDGRVAFVGGLNIDDRNLLAAEGGAGWRDTHLRLEGPAARELEYFFRRTWTQSGGAPLDETRYAHDGRRADPQVRVVTNDLRRGRIGILEEYRTAIQGARERVYLTNAYFLPGRRILRPLAEAARRGVDVRVMVAGTTDVAPVLLAGRTVYGRLLEAGVRLFEWRGRVLHAKTAVVDGRWSTVGSSNLDAQSLWFNLEANAVVEDAAFAAAMERMFTDDLAHCEEVDDAHWRRRTALDRAVSSAAYLLRNWL